MDSELSTNAKAILDAGIQAGRAAGSNTDALAEADKAVEYQIRQIAIDNPQDCYLKLFDVFREFAKLAVRQQLSQRLV